MNQNPIKPSPSTATIVVWFVLFWPVGLYFLLKRLDNDRYQAFQVKSGINAGGVAMLVGAIMLSMVFGFGTLPLLLLVGGIATVTTGSKRNAQAKKYRQYIDLIVNHNEHSIPRIASMMGVGDEIVKKDLQAMIAANILANAYIDYSSQEIWMRNPENDNAAQRNMGAMGAMGASQTYQPPYQPPQQQSYGAPQTPKRQIIVSCKGCGANHVLDEGEVKYCDYCGSPLSAS